MNCIKCKEFFNLLKEHLKSKKLKSFNKIYIKELFNVNNVNEILSCLMSCGYIKYNNLDKTSYIINIVL